MSGQMTGLDQLGKSEPLFALDLYQVASLFDGAELPRNRRSLSRYCTRNKLDCEKVETLNGEEWRIDEQSVVRLIAQIKEQQRLTRQDISGQAQPGHTAGNPGNSGLTTAGHDQAMPDSASLGEPETAPNISADQPGQDETGEVLLEPEIASGNERLLKQIERENDLLRDQLDKKDAQIDKKDKQIDDLIERGREDKHLIHNFQRKLGMLEAPTKVHVNQDQAEWTAPVGYNAPDTSAEQML